MKTTIIRTMAGLFVSAVLVTACGSTAHDPATEEPMTATLTTLDEGVHTLEHHVMAHGDVIAAAADLTAVGKEEAAQMTSTMDLHHAMNTQLDHMAMCMHDGAAPNTDAMSLRVDDLGKEIDGHLQAMSAAADMKAARAEEDRHQAAIMKFVNDMHADHDEMAKTAQSYMCPMSHDTSHM